LNAFAAKLRAPEFPLAGVVQHRHLVLLIAANFLCCAFDIAQVADYVQML
jgi:hypothetical protein